jgi:DNA topoisomerase-3
MADQIVITEKTSQAKDIRTAVGSRYGDILPAEGHLFDLLEPEDVVPAWKRSSPILLRPEGLYGTRPADKRMAFGLATGVNQSGSIISCRRGFE